ncbi:BQ2448_1965 [Microbotryum intermedium]|uniref:BQ2448_1965 protein n=1 Tax=Microbotryum intermedium TaxID=269621 RepID=A0A238F6Y0_9BASI|nr:BQ2448_1965 [Microbotryum intermedium]
MSSKERGMWLLAIETEKAALAAKGTFSPALYLPPGTPIIKSKWVLAIKRDSEGRIEKYKARLVARGGMQKAGRDYKETFSPTGRAASHRLLLGLAVENEWETRQFDVSSAYLNGEMGDVVVHMELPDKSVVRLRKTLYGLCQAGREWYKVFAGWIESIDFVRTECDHAVFVKIEGAHKLFLSIHVDDDLLTGDGDLDGFITQLKSRFESKSSDEATFFLGQRIVREGKTGAAIVHQPHFISSILEDHDMAGCSSRPTPMCLYKSRTPNNVPFDASTKPYRTIVGKLLFLSGTTRPDIAFAVSKVASHCNNFSQVDWEALMHILRYLQGTRNVGLLFRRSDAPGAPLLRGFVDADHGADPETRRSVTGFVFLCAGGAVSWMSKRQALVTVSSTEAEYVAMSFAAREGIWLRRLLSELGFAQSEPTRLHGDNQSAIQLAKHPAFHARTKHIGIHFHFIRDHIAEGTIEMVWIPTNTMAADVLTKGLGTRKHWDFVHAMGLVDASREGASWKERQAVEEVCAVYARVQEHIPERPIICDAEAYHQSRMLALPFELDCNDAALMPWNHATPRGIEQRLDLVQRLGHGRTSTEWSARWTGIGNAGHSTGSQASVPNAPEPDLVAKVVSAEFAASVAREYFVYVHNVPSLSPAAQAFFPRFHGLYRSGAGGHAYVFVLENGGERLTEDELTSDSELQNRTSAAFKLIASEGLFHGDEREANILRRMDGSICLVDWGEASLRVSQADVRTLRSGRRRPAFLLGLANNSSE